MYAVVVAGGKQFRVTEGEIIEVEKIDGNNGDKVELKKLMTVDGDKVMTETGVTTAEIVSQGRSKKIIVFKYKAKKNERKKIGHRQYFTRVKIVKI